MKKIYSFIIILFLTFSLHAQEKYIDWITYRGAVDFLMECKIINVYDEAKNLSRQQLYSLLIDTTDYSKLSSSKQFLAKHKYDKVSHAAYILLAKRGETQIIDSLRNRYYKFFTVKNYFFTIDYLKALDVLNAPDVHQLYHEFVDTLFANKSYGLYYELDEAIRYFCNNGDFSFYDKYRSTPHPTPGILAKFGKNPLLRPQVYTQLKTFLNNPNNDYKISTIAALTNFPDNPETYTLLKQIAFSDTSMKIRKEAIYWFIDTYHDVSILPACMPFVTPPIIDTSLTYEVIEEMSSFITPLVTDALQKLFVQLTPNSSFHTYINYRIMGYQNYLHEHLDSLSIPAALDTLTSFTKQTAELNWVGKTKLINELTLTITTAKNYYFQSKKKLCILELQKYNEKLETVYKSTESAKSLPVPFVTKDGYEFLTANANYILERLKK